MQTLQVALAERSYPIHIGEGLLDVAALFLPYLAGGRVAVITDSNVAPLYMARVKNLLEAADVTVIEVVVPAGEGSKSWRILDEVLDQLLAAHCDRDTLILALGGGVIGDLAGFAAAIYQRGVSFLQVPTTLLAQVDSSVGGKTAINHTRGKNMIGAFYQPRAVIIDVEVLRSLPERELRAGLAEVIKHGLILDPEFTVWLEQNIENLVARDPRALIHAIKRSCELKAQVVGDDEREGGVRAILNFGHTFGHAIETGMGYGNWLHGEAVAAGMMMAAELSARAGMLAFEDVRRVQGLIERAGLPAAGPALSAERYFELMATDKKAAQGRPRFVLLKAIGHACLRSDLDESWIRASIASRSAKTG
ncbi:MAG: 3-dehydroquinate synthase [Betaproteobacteria bacterium]|nr:3-dehydroquinate synthase [Betaproteobacteria bacterium]